MHLLAGDDCLERGLGYGPPKLVFYSKIESSLKTLQEQAAFESVIFRTSICSAKF
jgi:hypothetical protein